MTCVPCGRSVMATCDRVRAWVLHRRPYRNTSLIVDLVTRESGRLAGVARSGQRQPLWQSFRPLRISASGRGDLLSLGAVESDGVTVPLQGEALYCGLYLNELLARLMPRHDPHPSLFDGYEAALSLLADASLPADVVLRHFEFRLLDELGYGLTLDRDEHGAALQPGGRYHWLPDRGLVADDRGPYQADILDDIVAGHWHDDARRHARDLMREALAPHLGGRPLVSRSLFRHAGKGDN